MIIAFDIGNSSINMGFFTEGGLFAFSLPSYPPRPPREISDFLVGRLGENRIENAPEGVIISSVVSGLTGAVSEAVRILWDASPAVLRAEDVRGLELDLKKAAEVGVDRLAGAVGANVLYGAPVCVVDFGTATTVNFVGRGNVFKGGAIMPGLGLMKRALYENTSSLPDVELVSPGPALGKDTEGNILSGIMYGTAGAVERIIFEVESSEEETYRVVLTGGYSEVVRPVMKRADFIEPHIVLKGLKFIYEGF